jgi:XTP/dITP diphosphohydrolase
MKIIFATKNNGKVKELKKLFKENGLENIELLSLNDLGENVAIEETGKTFEENAIIKAEAIFKKFQMPVISDDSGLIVKELVDKPGIFSARYAGKNATDFENNSKLLNDVKHLDNREAYFECALVYMDKNGKKFFANEKCYGEIIDEPRGTNGFGYDPVFFLREFGKTMAEMDSEMKNKISHRGKAFKKLAKFLKG